MNKPIIMVVDTETTTLASLPAIGTTEQEKTTIATANPLVYQIAWTIYKGTTCLVKRNYLIDAVYNDTGAMSVAYYGKKVPQYEQMLADGSAELVPFQYAMNRFDEDYRTCKVDTLAAYNTQFDFQRAIPFTDLYNIALNKYASSPVGMQQWIKDKEDFSRRLIKERCDPCRYYHGIDNDKFEFHGKSYPVIDIWDMFCGFVRDDDDFKIACLDHSMLTRCGDFFGTSAEVALRFIEKRFGYIESHTAESDCVDEYTILSYLLDNGVLMCGHKPFPLTQLGRTSNFLLTDPMPKDEHIQTVVAQMDTYLKTAKPSSFVTGIRNKRDELTGLLLP